MRVTRYVLAAALLATLQIPPMTAQTLESLRRSEKTGEGLIDITVQYAFVMPTEAGAAPDKQLQAMDAGRTLLYAAAGKECPLLLATIAESCRLLRLAVQSQMQRYQGPQPPTITMSGSATFRITPK